MERYLKFLATIDRKRRLKIVAVLQRIKANDLGSLHVGALQGWDNMYRCRVGNVRIIFTKHPGGNTIIDVDFRKDVYKRLKH